MQSARMIQGEGKQHDISRDMRSGGITGLYPTADGWLYLSANTTRFWRWLCVATRLEALSDDPRYGTVKKCAAHADELVPRLCMVLATR